MYDWLTGLSSNSSFVGSYLQNPNSFDVGNLFGPPVGYGQPSANSFLAELFTQRNSYQPFYSDQDLLLQSLSQGAFRNFAVGAGLGNSLIQNPGMGLSPGFLAITNQGIALQPNGLLHITPFG